MPADDPADTRTDAGRRVLLGQLIANGDCLYATAVARQIKHDQPDCHLTWAVSTRCKSVLIDNPHVDAIWEWPAFGNEQVAGVWAEFERQARARQAEGEFDDIYLTQFSGENFTRWDGNLRSSIFRGYPQPITVPVAPVVRLTAQEIDNVRRFAAAHGLARRAGDDHSPDPPVILLECAPGSRQSFMTPALALDVTRRLLERFPALRVILSSHLPMADAGPRVLDGNRLSFRENAELSHYCTLLLGCSSGLTWLCTSEAARNLPTVQVLSNQSFDANRPVLDHERWGLPTDGIIEMFDCTAERVSRCVQTVLESGFAAARRLYHQRPKERFFTYRMILKLLIARGDYRQAAVLFWRNRGTLASAYMWAWHLSRPVKWLAERLRRGETAARFFL